MFSIRTDLAIEAKEIYETENRKSIKGVDVEEYSEGDIKVTNVHINNREGEMSMGKPRGTYVTIDMPEFVHYDGDTMDEVSKVLAKVLEPLIKIDDSMTALVVGLGNWNITADAVGPRVTSKLMVTRHLKEFVPDSIDEGIRPVCAISPGVLGITGIETGEIIKGIVDDVKPNVIICVDSLAARKMERVNSTIQIGNTGISPGSGVKNKRMEISEARLGVPVIAIGIPTVVDATTMANDTIDLVIDEMKKTSDKKSGLYTVLNSMNKNEKQRLIEKLLNPYVGDLMVTPKDVDIVIDSVSRIIANGINIALQPALDLEDINRFLN